MNNFNSDYAAGLIYKHEIDITQLYRRPDSNEYKFI